MVKRPAQIEKHKETWSISYDICSAARKCWVSLQCAVAFTCCCLPPSLGSTPHGPCDYQCTTNCGRACVRGHSSCTVHFVLHLAPILIPGIATIHQSKLVICDKGHSSVTMRDFIEINTYQVFDVDIESYDVELGRVVDYTLCVSKVLLLQQKVLFLLLKSCTL